MLLKHQKGKSRALGPGTTAAWEFSKEMFFHEKTPAGRKRNVLWKHISFKVRGAQTAEMQSREHEILGSCLVPCAPHRSQGFLLCAQPSAASDSAKTQPEGSQELGVSCSHRKSKEWLEARMCGWAVPFTLRMLRWSYFCRFISTRKYQYLYI